MDDFIEWLARNQELIVLSWGAIIALAEVLKRAIPGTKDDEIIVKVLDTVGKAGTLGASALLPNQDGKLKS